MSKEEWREWVSVEFGGWRSWALAKVAGNWRIRQRLPRLTKLAKAKGLI